MNESFFKDEEEKPTEPGAKKDTEIDEGKSAAIFAYIPFLCFIPLVKMRNNDFAVKHGKQGLILLLIEIVAILFLAIPRIGELFWAAVLILCILSAASGIVYVVNGKIWKIPFIGELGEKVKL